MVHQIRLTTLDLQANTFPSLGSDPHLTCSTATPSPYFTSFDSPNLGPMNKESRETIEPPRADWLGQWGKNPAVVQGLCLLGDSQQTSRQADEQLDRLRRRDQTGRARHGEGLGWKTTYMQSPPTASQDDGGLGPGVSITGNGSLN